ncbi:NAD(P)-dependent oxidoreductase [Sphingobium yanoikuyae]|uniref:NAD(P)-dependent oxidoreductase n=1 Tax=Sphingobium yanoikuyae TaxID=13690 RepID=UPI0022DD744F|nr:NAD(P)-dependent oxidoreductase [Sphingobium yanoikuyae]WBQ19295.1 NAD(P)-dependent oxidoreductase [Sphingobium yanoikuyae]
MSGMERIGFIGLGSQGGPMAERIAAAGYPLMLWARRADALAPFLEKGATAAPDIATLGAICDHVGICVVDDAGVAEIVGQLLPAMRPGSRIVIHSTILPDHCVALAERFSGRGIAFLDAPVSGGGPAAATGSLTVMCGGTSEAYAAARPVLESFGGLIVRMGDVGAGQRAKIVNNALMAANMGLAHAAMEAGRALELDGTALRDLIKASSGRSFGFEVYARLPTPGAFAHGAPLLRKDVGLLMSSLPDDAGAEALSRAAMPFLSAACGD